MGKTYRRFDGDWIDDHVNAELKANKYVHYCYNRKKSDEDLETLWQADYDWEINWRRKQRTRGKQESGRSNGFKHACARSIRQSNRRGYHVVKRGTEDEIDNFDWHTEAHGKEKIWDFW